MWVLVAEEYEEDTEYNKAWCQSNDNGTLP